MVTRSCNRRDFLRLAAGGATLLAAGVGCNSGSGRPHAATNAPTSAGKGNQTLRIAQWNHYVAGYDTWTWPRDRRPPAPERQG
jgi:hypothetical protein